MFGIKTPAGLVKFVSKHVGQPYWYGTCAWPCTQRLLDDKARQYPGHYTAARMPRYRQDIANRRTCADCVGLIKGYGWQRADGTVGYGINGVPDQSANQMYNSARTKGNIASIPYNRAGIAVWFSGHIGVYIGGGDVVEARGFAHGIVKTKLGSRPWTHWLQVPWLNYGLVTAPAPQPVYPLGFGERVLRLGDTGEDVRCMQRALIDIGFGVGHWGADGNFGAATRDGVIAYQRDRGLSQDGIVGPLTRMMMERDLPIDLNSDASDEIDMEKTRPEGARIVRIEDGDAWIRNMPCTTRGLTMAVARNGSEYVFAGETSDNGNGWLTVTYGDEDEQTGWVSRSFARLAE